MSKKILATATLLPMLFVVASCNKTQEVSLSKKVDASSILTAKMVDQNIKSNQKNIEKLNLDKTSYKTGEFHISTDGEYTDFQEIENTGCIAVLKDDGKMGVYSLVLNKFIIDAVHDPDNEYLDIIHSVTYGYEDIPFFILAKENNVKIIDTFGNKLLDIDDNLNDEPVIEFKKVNGVDYIKVKAIKEDETEIEKLYKYDKDENLVKVYKIPSFDSELLEEDDPNLNFGFDELFDNNSGMDLDNFGYEGYRIVEGNNIITVYNDKGEVLHQHHVTNSYYVVGNNLYYQIFYDVDPKSEDYDFYEDGGKYNFDTIKLDLITGKSSAIDLNFLINNYYPYMDEEGIYNYAVLNIQTIDERKNLSSPYDAFVNKEFDLKANVTGLFLNSFFKFGNNYVNFVSQTVYNNEMKPIFKYGNSLISYSFTNKVVVVDYHGRELLLDENGKVLIDNNYSDIKITEKGKCAFAKRKENIDVIDLTTLKVIETFKEYECNNIFNDLYIYEKDGATKLASNDGVLMTFNNKITQIDKDISNGIHQPFGCYVKLVDEDGKISFVGFKSQKINYV